MEIIKGPDFPTGATILGKGALRRHTAPACKDRVREL